VTRNKDKAQIQAEALGVVIGWLRQESHIDHDGDSRSLKWAQEAQDRIACFVELEVMKLRLKSKTLRIARSAHGGDKGE